VLKKGSMRVVLVTSIVVDASDSCTARLMQCSRAYCDLVIEAMHVTAV
jgi:uncharacterized protein with von Willebrand factor type A (vWA) domain